MKRHAQPAVIVLALSAFFGLAQAQMNTPQPSGPPSAQPVPKSPSQQPSAESGAAVGGPQITVPLRPRAKETLPASGASDATKPTKAQALQKCKAESSRTARKACRDQVKRDFTPAPNP